MRVRCLDWNRYRSSLGVKQRFALLNSTTGSACSRHHRGKARCRRHCSVWPADVEVAHRSGHWPADPLERGGPLGATQTCRPPRGCKSHGLWRVSWPAARRQHAAGDEVRHGECCGVRRRAMPPERGHTAVCSPPTIPSSSMLLWIPGDCKCKYWAFTMPKSMYTVHARDCRYLDQGAPGGGGNRGPLRVIRRSTCRS